jgi:hypothetical protein
MLGVTGEQLLLFKDYVMACKAFAIA